jgi:hypothetical protein
VRIAALAVTALMAAAPTTTITSGPDGQTTQTVATFAFSAEGAAGFECSIDGAPFEACTSPYSRGGLGYGPHTFSARAHDAAGNVEASPPVRSWTIVAPPTTPSVITVKRPKKLTMKIRDFRMISGRASSDAGIARVLVALSRPGVNKKFFPARCRYVNLMSGLPVSQPCILPRYRRAIGTTSWQLAITKRVRKRLTPGPYILTIRVLNKFGASTRQDLHLKLL